jgi:predicted acylesterase/phospholipase RssA
MLFILLIMAVITAAETATKPNLICRALSLSGGGSKGAYEVGVLHQMARQLQGEDKVYDVMSGISVGSLNAAAMSLFEKGDELA